MWNTKKTIKKEILHRKIQHFQYIHHILNSFGGDEGIVYAIFCLIL